IEKEFFVLAINRIYYGMFYMLLALALKEGFKTSKHHQLLGWFNKEFVKPGKVNREIGKIIHRGFEDRTDGDYGVFVEFERDEVESKFCDMKLFISELKEIIIKDL
ncbi:MAG: HEPN domain-containing protein, partial [Draconibacterium sp.]|nr:HEPN domain-containing protein [Draconibacterium sp.]